MRQHEALPVMSVKARSPRAAGIIVISGEWIRRHRRLRDPCRRLLKLQLDVETQGGPMRVFMWPFSTLADHEVGRGRIRDSAKPICPNVIDRGQARNS